MGDWSPKVDAGGSLEGEAADALFAGGATASADKGNQGEARRTMAMADPVRSEIQLRPVFIRRGNVVPYLYWTAVPLVADERALPLLFLLSQGGPLSISRRGSPTAI